MSSGVAMDEGIDQATCLEIAGSETLRLLENLSQLHNSQLQECERSVRTLLARSLQCVCPGAPTPAAWKEEGLKISQVSPCSGGKENPNSEFSDRSGMQATDTLDLEERQDASEKAAQVLAEYEHLQQQLHKRTFMEFFKTKILHRTGKTKTDIMRIHQKMKRRRLGWHFTHRMVHKPNFNAFFAAAIILNAVFMAFQADMEIKHAINHHVEGHADESAVGFPSWMREIDAVFSILFVIELLLRIIGDECEFFMGPEYRWNLLDTASVLSSIVDALVTFSGHDISLVRIARVLRMFKTVRVVRLVRFFRDLRLILVCIVDALLPLLWALIFLTLLTFFFSVIFLHGVGGYIESDPDSQHVQELIKFYPGLFGAVVSLFMAITGGINWGEMYLPMAQTIPFYGSFFLLYLALMILAVMNIITGIFVESTKELSQMDKELATQAHMDHLRAIFEELKTLFYELDERNTGSITLDAFKSHIEQSEIQAYFSALNLDTWKPQEIFELLDVDQSGEVTIEEFITGCMRFKGLAKTADLETVLHHSKRHFNRFQAHAELVSRRLASLERHARNHSRTIARTMPCSTMKGARADTIGL